MTTAVTDPPEQTFLRVSDVARRLRIHYTTVQKLLYRGELKYSKYHGMVRISQSDFDEFLAKWERPRAAN